MSPSSRRCRRNTSSPFPDGALAAPVTSASLTASRIAPSSGRWMASVLWPRHLGWGRSGVQKANPACTPSPLADWQEEVWCPFGYTEAALPLDEGGFGWG